jgi:hypothetical protein
VLAQQKDTPGPVKRLGACPSNGFWLGLLASE